MDSKEFGLVAAQQLLQLEDLHYGYWQDGRTATIQNYPQAQTDYTTFLIQHIEDALGKKKGQPARILDIGCGIGVTTARLLEMGYEVDGLVPSPWMAERARERVAPHVSTSRGTIFECTFEDFPLEELKEKYDLAVFSESFQYVHMPDGFSMLDKILVPGGRVVIFDFFRRDNVPGKSPLGGGKPMKKFHTVLDESSWALTSDLDVTENISPTMRLMQEVLVTRILPFSRSLHAFLSTRFGLPYRILRFFFRKRLAELDRKYSEDRNEENFIKYKTYRLMVLDRKE